MTELTILFIILSVVGIIGAAWTYYKQKSHKRSQVLLSWAMTYKIQKILLIYYLILLGSLFLSINARAHIEISPQRGSPDEWKLYTINVPTEIESPTTEVELVIPNGYEVEVIEHQERWNLTTERDAAGLIRKIKWKGNKIPSLTFEEFKFIAKNPKDIGSFWWTAYQKYENGDESTWNFQTFVKKEEESKSSPSPPAKETEEAIEKAKVATFASFIAIGVTIALIVVVAIALWQTSKQKSNQLSAVSITYRKALGVRA